MSNPTRRLQFEIFRYNPEDENSEPHTDVFELQIPLGALSDRVGRLPVIVVGLAVFAAGSILAGLSESIYGVIAGRLLQGAGAISATLSALITDATRAEVRTRSMAALGIGIGFSFMLAMILGPLLAAKFGVPALFWVGAALAGGYLGDRYS